MAKRKGRKKLYGAAAMAAAAKRKRGRPKKRKNPFERVYRHRVTGKKKRSGVRLLTPKELQGVFTAGKKYLQIANSEKRFRKANKGKKSVSNREYKLAKKRGHKMLMAAKRMQRAKAQDARARARLEEQGYVEDSALMFKGFPKATTRRRRNKKNGKKGKQKLMAKKKKKKSRKSGKKSKKSASRRKNKKRAGKRRSARRVVLSKKGSSVRIKLGRGRKAPGFSIRRNPFGLPKMDFQSLTGHSIAEAGALLAGGALYARVNQMAMKVPGVAKIVTIPVVGPSLPTILIGAILQFAGKKIRQPILADVGKGLIGASVVGLGVNVAAKVPMLQPQGSVALPKLGDGADFGASADFGGVDYTPDMAGVDYTPDLSGNDAGQLGGQLGASDEDYIGDNADFGGVDYTMDGVPDGLAGQMG